MLWNGPGCTFNCTSVISSLNDVHTQVKSIGDTNGSNKKNAVSLNEDQRSIKQAGSLWMYVVFSSSDVIAWVEFELEMTACGFASPLLVLCRHVLALIYQESFSAQAKSYFLHESCTLCYKASWDCGAKMRISHCYIQYTLVSFFWGGCNGLGWWTGIVCSWGLALEAGEHDTLLSRWHHMASAGVWVDSCAHEMCPRASIIGYNN